MPQSELVGADYVVVHVLYVAFNPASEDFECASESCLFFCGVYAIYDDSGEEVADFDDVAKGYRDRDHGGYSWGYSWQSFGGSYELIRKDSTK